MQPTITSEVVVAYAQCPRKAYLLLFSPDSGAPHEYECILAERARTQRIAYLNTLRHEREHVQVYDPEAVADDRAVLIEVRLTPPGVEASCDALLPMHTERTRHTPLYRPTLVVGTYTIT